MQKDYFGYSPPAHHTSSDQTFLTCTFMQICSLRNINLKPVSLRSTPCSRITFLITEDAFGLDYLLELPLLIVKVYCLRKLWSMILVRYLKTQTLKKKGKPKFERITQPNSLRSFNHKETGLNLCSIHFLRMRNDYFRYRHGSNMQI